MKCFKTRELCTETSSRAGFGSRLKTWTAEEQQSEKVWSVPALCVVCVRDPEALEFPRGPSKTNVVRSFVLQGHGQPWSRRCSSERPLSER